VPVLPEKQEIRDAMELQERTEAEGNQDGTRNRERRSNPSRNSAAAKGWPAVRVPLVLKVHPATQAATANLAVTDVPGVKVPAAPTARLAKTVPPARVDLEEILGLRKTLMADLPARLVNQGLLALLALPEALARAEKMALPAVPESPDPTDPMADPASAEGTASPETVAKLAHQGLAISAHQPGWLLAIRTILGICTSLLTASKRFKPSTTRSLVVHSTNRASIHEQRALLALFC
jgi:hypothetical protein